MKYESCHDPISSIWHDEPVMYLVQNKFTASKRIVTYATTDPAGLSDDTYTTAVFRVKPKLSFADAVINQSLNAA